jgi:Phosphate transport regulator (distant homolog of PhoU)
VGLIMKLTGGKIFEDVVSEITHHSSIVRDGVKLLNEIIEKYDTLSLEELQENYASLSNMENQADELKRKLMNMLKATHIHPEDREDFLRLVLRIDEIIGYSKAVAKKLLVFKHLNIVIPSSVSTYVKAIINKSVESVEQLIKLVETIQSDMTHVLEIAHRIELLEKEVDDLRLRALEEIYKDCLTSYKVTCIALPIVIDDLEAITDLCQDVADIYRLHLIAR